MASAKERIFIGLYSGSSADGVDAAAVAVSGRGERMKVRQLGWLFSPFRDDLSRRIMDACGVGVGPDGLADIDADVSEYFAKAATAIMQKLGLAGESLAGVGVSGQLLGLGCGGGGGCSAIVLGSPAVVSAATGATAVGDFIGGDLAAGGVGGPVTAWPNWLLMKDSRLSRVVVHLGGTATLTFVPAAAKACDVVACDVGPGTIAIDALARKILGASIDDGGASAARGTVSGALLHELMDNDYFRHSGAKASSPQRWGPIWQERLEMLAARHRCEGEDLLATTTELSARIIADAVGSLTERPHEVILAGGGAANIHLAGRIRTLLSPCSTYVVERYGISLRAHRAVCFALLAAARLDKISAHCPQASGASRQAVLGAIHLPF